MFKHYSAKQKRRIVSNLVIYTVFIGMIFYYVYKKGFDTGFMVFIGIAGVLSVIGLLYYEYLNYHYLKSLHTLNFKIQPDLALEEFEHLLKLDITNTYKKDRAIFDVAVYSVKKEEDKVLEIIAKEDERFRSSIEMLAIRAYYLMKAYLSLKDFAKVEEVYQDVKAIEKMKKHPEPIPLNLYHGYHFIAIGNLNRAYDCFKEIDRSRINPKEEKELLERLIQTSKKEAQKDKYRRELNKLLEKTNKC